jgi:hypothetical protein
MFLKTLKYEAARGWITVERSGGAHRITTMPRST